jgi:hypothetical protein
MQKETDTENTIYYYFQRFRDSSKEPDRLRVSKVVADHIEGICMYVRCGRVVRDFESEAKTTYNL